MFPTTLRKSKHMSMHDVIVFQGAVMPRWWFELSLIRKHSSNTSSRGGFLNGFSMPICTAPNSKQGPFHNKHPRVLWRILVERKEYEPGDSIRDLFGIGEWKRDFFKINLIKWPPTIGV